MVDFRSSQDNHEGDETQNRNVIDKMSQTLCIALSSSVVSIKLGHFPLELVPVNPYHDRDGDDDKDEDESDDP